jgi:hypothetical protein
MIDNPYASATPDDSPNQTINDKLCDGTILIDYGKAGHGMNGKHADLDSCGQCLVTELVTVDPVGADNMRIDIHLRLYATICAPSYDSIDYDGLKAKASPESKEFLREYYGVDLDTLDINDDSPENEEKIEKIVDYFREQAESIVCDMNATPDDPFAIMWNDDAWEGGIDVTLSVPLTVDEYDEIEDGNEETLDIVARRIYDEILDGNKGGTPERDRMKIWEEEIALCNKMINELECYG